MGEESRSIQVVQPGIGIRRRPATQACRGKEAGGTAQGTGGGRRSRQWARSAGREIPRRELKPDRQADALSRPNGVLPKRHASPDQQRAAADARARQRRKTVDRWKQRPGQRRPTPSRRKAQDSLRGSRRQAPARGRDEGEGRTGPGRRGDKQKRSRRGGRQLQSAESSARRWRFRRGGTVRRKERHPWNREPRSIDVRPGQDLRGGAERSPR